MMKLLLASLAIASVAALTACEEEWLTTPVAAPTAGDFDAQPYEGELNDCEREAATIEAQTGVAYFHNGYHDDGSCYISGRDLEGDNK